MQNVSRLLFEPACKHMAGTDTRSRRRIPHFCHGMYSWKLSLTAYTLPPAAQYTTTTDGAYLAGGGAQGLGPLRHVGLYHASDALSGHAVYALHMPASNRCAPDAWFVASLTPMELWYNHAGSVATRTVDPEVNLASWCSAIGQSTRPGSSLRNPG